MFIPFRPVARIIGHWLSLIGQKVGTLAFLRTRRHPAGIFLGIYQASTHIARLNVEVALSVNIEQPAGDIRGD